MKTLDIGSKAIDYTMKRKQRGAFCDTDMRGTQLSKNKIEKETDTNFFPMDRVRFTMFIM
jgi:hypothetical protein